MSRPKQRTVTVTGIWRAFRTIVWPRRRLLLFGLFLIFINRLCGLVLPTSTMYVIDDVIPNKDSDLLIHILVIVLH